MTVRSNYFTNCLGVFEGGGVRGSAFAGAYLAAQEAGIQFSRLAGTSAGSIIAALIAAGAGAEFVREKLMEKDFKDFLKPVDRNSQPFKSLKGWKSLLRLAPGKEVRTLVSLADYGGLYNSSEIEGWIEGLLRELLKERGPELSGRAIQFSDLPIPLSIVSSDASTASPVLWSKETTPNESVAFAVRCSSNLPFFFQPIRRHSQILVDGGVLSNVPAFVFSKLNSANLSRFSERILVFRLFEEQKGSVSVENFIDYVGAVANTAVSGNSSIQIALQPDTFVINISTGSIKATDFDSVGSEKKDILFSNGRTAVLDFLKREREEVAKIRTATQYNGFDERMLVYVQLIGAAHRAVWLSEMSSYWVWSIFPAIFSALQRGVSIYFVTNAARKDADYANESQRRALLQRLGVNICEVDELPLSGLIVDPETPQEVAALSSVSGYLRKDYSYEEGQVKIYTLSEDYPVIESVRKTIRPSILQNMSKQEKYTLRPCNFNKITFHLGKVPQYRSARFELTDIDLYSNIKVIMKYVKEYKYIQIDKLMDDFKDVGVEMFHPQEIVFSDGSTSIISPPIFERDGERLILIDGHARVLYCKRNGISKFKAIVVDGVMDALPGVPQGLDKLRISSGTLPIDGAIDRYSSANYRQIDAFLRPRDEVAQGA